ncbi:acyltransferase family protein [Pseudomonas fluorescens]|uniref:acyltransferase family protein n=1 Tax=Pseudomonas fluorescens TaxID=294 RepID=UPI001BE504F9|nr:acyltransferase [Pseudomonas fluorescens]MBT2375747.1 acyltransferase [Pseudomonas fluorescens]
MKHIQGFDELRAVAVIAVMFYHLGWTQFGYGWAGVPFFFVISGFLITGILLDNKDSQPGNYFYTFYARRCLRIFPLYYLYLFVIALWCAALGVQTSGWTHFLLYLQNYYLGANQFHLVPGMELGHTWTLAVEEQFYMIWPFLIFFVGRHYLKPMIFFLITASVLSRFWIGENTSYVPFAPLTSNLDTLCLGALLAIIYRERKTALGWVAWGSLFFGVGMIAYQAQGSPLSLNGSNSWFQLGLALLFAGIVGLVVTDKKMTIQWPLLVA